MVFAIALIPLLIAIGVAVDLLRAQTGRSALQSAADAAALAAGASVSNSTATMRDVAQRFLDANSAELGLTINDVTITPSSDSAGRKLVEIAVTAQIPTSFLRAINIEELTIRTLTKVRRGEEGPPELVMKLN